MYFVVRNENSFACYSNCFTTWCPLTKGIVASQRRTRNALPNTFDIGVFKTVKNNSTQKKHIYV